MGSNRSLMSPNLVVRSSPDADFLLRYLEVAPVSLALERAIECRLLSSFEYPRPLLDVGCGDGTFVSVLFGESVDVGCDVSFEELSKARLTGRYRWLVQADASALPFRSRAFASVVSNSTLEHVRRLEPALRELARVSDSGGTVTVTVPTTEYQRLFFWSRFLRLLRIRRLADTYESFVNRLFRHRHVASVEAWRRKLEDAGLVTLSARLYLTPFVVALDDLLYPVAGVGLVLRRITGSYVWPSRVRRPVARLLAGALRGAYGADTKGSGGYVLLRARPSGVAV